MFKRNPITQFDEYVRRGMTGAAEEARTQGDLALQESLNRRMGAPDLNENSLQGIAAAIAQETNSTPETVLAALQRQQTMSPDLRKSQQDIMIQTAVDNRGKAPDGTGGGGPIEGYLGLMGGTDVASRVTQVGSYGAAGGALTAGAAGLIDIMQYLTSGNEQAEDRMDVLTS